MRSQIFPVIASALKQVAALCGLALIPAFISGAIQLEPARQIRVAEITPAEILASNAQFVWVDARPAAAFSAGHAADAVPLEIADWDRLVPPFLDAWHPDKIVVVYDDGGSSDAAQNVARRIHEELQMNNVRVLKGGWRRWQGK